MFKKNRPKPTLAHSDSYENNNVVKGQNVPPSPISPISKASLQFHCQLAHGSPTVFVSGFANVKELYQKIAECFDFPASEVRPPGPERCELSPLLNIWPPWSLITAINRTDNEFPDSDSDLSTVTETFLIKTVMSIF
jgi:hypothetical protein